MLFEIGMFFPDQPLARRAFRPGQGESKGRLASKRRLDLKVSTPGKNDFPGPRGIASD